LLIFFHARARLCAYWYQNSPIPDNSVSDRCRWVRYRCVSHWRPAIHRRNAKTLDRERVLRSIPEAYSVVPANVWSAAGLQGFVWSRDKSAQMYSAFRWRSVLLARMSCARVCPSKSVGRWRPFSGSGLRHAVVTVLSSLLHLCRLRWGNL
jgi:hypothetical protein